MLKRSVSQLRSLRYRTDYHLRCGPRGAFVPVLGSAVGHDVGALLAMDIRRARSQSAGVL